MAKRGQKKSKLYVYDDIWYLDLLEYAEFDSDVHFFCFVTTISFLGKLAPKELST